MCIHVYIYIYNYPHTFANAAVISRAGLHTYICKFLA